jgi:hypothetical protein
MDRELPYTLHILHALCITKLYSILRVRYSLIKRIAKSAYVEYSEYQKESTLQV